MSRIRATLLSLVLASATAAPALAQQPQPQPKPAAPAPAGGAANKAGAKNAPAAAGSGGIQLSPERPVIPQLIAGRVESP